MIFVRMPRKPKAIVFQKALRAVKADLNSLFPGAELETSVLEGTEANAAERMIKKGYPAWSFDDAGDIQRLDPATLNPTPLVVRYAVPALDGVNLVYDFERAKAFVALLVADGTLRFDAAEYHFMKLGETFKAASTGGIDKVNERLASLNILDETPQFRITEHFRRREIELRHPEFARLAEAVRGHFAPMQEDEAEPVPTIGMR